jgi:hypothetical protein
MTEVLTRLNEQREKDGDNEDEDPGDSGSEPS